MTEAVERYLALGLRLGRHVDGLVDYDDTRLARLLCEQIAVSELQAAGTPA